MTQQPVPAQTATDARAEFTAGLRQLAFILDSNPDLPLPYDGTASPLLIMFFGPDAETNKAQMVDASRAIGGHWDKVVSDRYFDLQTTIRGISVKLCALRDEVCTKVVTGVREVTEMIQDPEALAAVPLVPVTKMVEDVEWECAPLLASAPVPGLAEHTEAACDTITRAADLASCGHPRNEDGECGCAWWPERAPIGA